jgi:hypothetical protein
MVKRRTRTTQKSINVTLLKRVNTLLGVIDTTLKDTIRPGQYDEIIKSRHRAKAHHLGVLLLRDLAGPDHSMVQEFASKTEVPNVDKF